MIEAGQAHRDVRRAAPDVLGHRAVVVDDVDKRLTDDENRVLPGVGAHAWLWTAPRDAYWSSLVRRW